MNIDRGIYGLNYFTVERMANQGHAPSLYECYAWRDPITEENVISKYIVPPISVKAGYLNEPLAYGLTAFQKIRLL
jgi:hypothetical protein